MSLRDQLLGLFPDLHKVPLPAYVAGGAVRDLLLGRTPNDVDVATNDPLTAARALNRKVIRLGKEEHISAYRVVRGEHVYDFAELLDHDIGADLARRDFTINAMAVDLASGELLDPHDGRGDLGRGLVRMVDPSNFDDDPLRMLKAVRMAVLFRFAIDNATLEAIRSRAGRIVDVAVERVTYELSLIFSAAQFGTATELLRRTGLDVPLELNLREGRDDSSYEMAMALLVDDPRTYGERWRWSEPSIRDAVTLQRLLRDHDTVALYDAGERLARMLPDPKVPLPDFTIKPFLTGDEIAAITGLAPGPELGRVKRALLVAQVKGEVKTKDDATRFVTASI